MAPLICGQTLHSVVNSLAQPFPEANTERIRPRNRRTRTRAHSPSPRITGSPPAASAPSPAGFRRTHARRPTPPAVASTPAPHTPPRSHPTRTIKTPPSPPPSPSSPDREASVFREVASLRNALVERSHDYGHDLLAIVQRSPVLPVGPGLAGSGRARSERHPPAGSAPDGHNHASASDAGTDRNGDAIAERIARRHATADDQYGHAVAVADGAIIVLRADAWQGEKLRRRGSAVTGFVSHGPPVHPPTRSLGGGHPD